MNRSDHAGLGLFLGSVLLLVGCGAPGQEGQDESPVESTDQALDRCNARTCVDCTALSSCGWGDGRCREGGASGPTRGTATEWAWISNYCPGYYGAGSSSGGGWGSSGGSSGGVSPRACAATDCTSCTMLSSCGWADGRCVAGSFSGPMSGDARSWSWTISSCSGGGGSSGGSSSGGSSSGGSSSGGSSSGGSSSGGSSLGYWACNVNTVQSVNIGGTTSNRQYSNAVGVQATSAADAAQRLYDEKCEWYLSSPSTLSCEVTGCGPCTYGMSPSTCAD